MYLFEKIKDAAAGKKTVICTNFSTVMNPYLLHFMIIGP